MNTHEHLFDLIKDFSTAMLVTGSGRELHGRPMAVAEFKPGSDAYFATSDRSPKIAEIKNDDHVLLTFQSRNEFVSVAGTATIVKDQALIERLWSDAWKVWFPGGKSDPTLCILKVAPTSAEYWDNSGAEGLKYLFEGAKALVQGKKPETDEKQNAKVTL